MGTTTPAIFHAPLTYLDDQKKQVVIGPSEIWFEGANLKMTDKHAGASNWLNALFRSGLIVPAPPGATAPRAAMQLRAKNPGAAGNNLQLDITYPDPSKPRQFTLTVSRTDAYKGLTKDTLLKVLGTATQAGTQPGLVRLKAAPAALPTESQTGNIPPADNAPNSWDVPENKTPGAKVAFTLEASDATFVPIKVELVAVAPTSGDPTPKLDLTATWKQTETVTPATDKDIGTALKTALAKFGAVLTDRTPDDGYAFPRSGKLMLQGGQDSTFASIAPSAK